MTAPTQQRQLTAAQIAAIVALLQAQTAARERLNNAAVAAAVAPFRTFTAWWDSTATDKAIAQILRTLQPLQRQLARQTDVFAARVLTVMSGRTVRPVGVVDVTQLRRKMPAKLVEQLADELVAPAWVDLGSVSVGPNESIVKPGGGPVATPSKHINDPFTELVASYKAEYITPADVYGRVADGARYDQVANGADEEKARQRAIVRVRAAAHTDMTLAVRAQYEKALKEGRTVRADGWRRILRPEMSKTGPCGLCVVAADRVYNRGDLMPIHDLCVCEVLPILGDLDPGLVLNVDDLNRIYAAAGNTGGDVIKNGKRHSGALKDLRVALTEHGELGPVLARADQSFRGMQQVAKTQSVDPQHRLEHQLEQLEKKFDQLIRRRRAGEDVDRPYEWHSNRIDEVHRELAALI